MEFKTKYNIGDEVYFMGGDTPLKDKILGIEIFCGRGNTKGGYMMTASDEYSVIYYYHTLSSSEEGTWATKEELLKYISSKIK